MLDVAIEDGDGVSVAERLEQVERFHKVKGEIAEGDLCIELELGADVLFFKGAVDGMNEFILKFRDVFLCDHESCGIVVPSEVEEELAVFFKGGQEREF